MACDNDVVRITMPAATAFDEKDFHSTLKSIGERFGCPKCFSGSDCLFQWERDFVLKGANALPQDPVPFRIELGGAVQLFIAQDVAGDIGALARAAQIAFDKLGCLPCSTGFDVLFRSQFRAIALDAKLTATTFGT